MRLPLTMSPTRDRQGSSIPSDTGAEQRPAHLRHVVGFSAARRFRPIQFAMMYAHAQKNLGPSGSDRRHSARRSAAGGAAESSGHARLSKAHGACIDLQLRRPSSRSTSFCSSRWLRDEIGSLDNMTEIETGKAISGFTRRSIRAMASAWAAPCFARSFVGERGVFNIGTVNGNRVLKGRSIDRLSWTRRSPDDRRPPLLYNAVTLEAVDALCSFMEDFRSRHAE